jgi:ketosteroid isomerase-like protein
MGATENLATVRRGYQAFNTADMNTLSEVIDKDASWHTPGRASLAGDHKGRDATFAYFGQLGSRTQGSFRAELQDLFVDEDGRVVGIHRCTADRDGKHLDVECCLVFDFKDGRIAGGSEHFDDLYGWDEFWS